MAKWQSFMVSWLGMLALRRRTHGSHAAVLRCLRLCAAPASVTVFPQVCCCFFNSLLPLTVCLRSDSPQSLCRRTLSDRYCRKFAIGLAVTSNVCLHKQQIHQALLHATMFQCNVCNVTSNGIINNASIWKQTGTRKLWLWLQVRLLHLHGQKSVLFLGSC